jgi:preprotein translocase subunit SecB
MENKIFKIRNVILLESQFSRMSEINYSNPSFETKDNINIDIQAKDNVLFVALTFTYSAGLKEVEQQEINARIKMLGVFEHSNADAEAVQQFGKINAPSIIFPFIREHLASLSAKSGVNTILLPPINFVALAEQNEKKQALP